jgi:pyruvate formate lyase activating enzyme
MSQNLSRREMIRAAAAGVCGLAACDGLCPAPARAGSPLRMKEALYWDKLGDRRVKCRLCPRECETGPGERGFCRIRENRSGVYYTLVYGSAAAINVDPIEKKPFFHVLPGARALSIGTAGCNLRCKNCQNWELSQSRPEQVDSDKLLPEAAASQARSLGCQALAYTYNEPVVWYEYMLDCADAGHREGVRSVMVSNGYINREPMRNLLPHLDAVKVDWKAVTEDFYSRYCGATLQPVLNTMNRVKALGKWLEVVYLVIPTLNDSDADIRGAARWMKMYMGTEVPLHFSRFIPLYQLKDLPPTPVATLERCYEVAREEGISFVYVGNAPGHKHESTYCPGCGKLLIERLGFEVSKNLLKEGKCPGCGRVIPGVWR